jgi:type IV secretion system protein VirB6
MNSTQLFTFLSAQIETPLETAGSNAATTLLTYVATPLKVALVLYIALIGLQIARGEMQQPLSELVRKIVAMGLVVWIITGAGIYQQYVYDLFFQTLPTSVINALSLGSTGNPTQIPSAFDTAWTGAWKAGLQVWQHVPPFQFAQYVAVVLFWAVAGLADMFCFAIYLVSKIMLVLYIALGPLFVGLVLFAPTRSIFERWVGSLISCVILQIAVVVYLSILLTCTAAILAAVQAAATGDSVAAIGVLFAGIIFFMLGAFVALQLPSFAASLSGGISFHGGAVAGLLVGSAVVAGSAAAKADKAVAGFAAPGVAAASKGLREAGSYIISRLRYPPGGSLSSGG